MLDGLREVVFDVAKHEIGHWLAWHCYGGTSSGIEVKIIKISVRHTGGFIPDLDWEISDVKDVGKYLKARLICLHA